MVLQTGIANSADTGINNSVFPIPEPYYFGDWSLRRGVVGVWNQSDEATEYVSLDTLLDSLTEPSTIVVESTFESYEIEKHDAFIDRCAKDGHTLRIFPTRLTGKMYREMTGANSALGKENSKKRDEDDAKAMRYAVATRGLDVLSKPKKEVDRLKRKQLREDANYRLMILRREGTKDDYATEIANRLPEPDKLPPFVLNTFMRRRATKKVAYDWHLVSLAVVGVAAEFARNREELDYLIGMSGASYGSQMRASLMHDGYGWWASSKPEKRPARATKQYLREYKRACRWVYSYLKHQG